MSPGGVGTPGPHGKILEPPSGVASSDRVKWGSGRNLRFSLGLHVRFLSLDSPGVVLEQRVFLHLILVVPSVERQVSVVDFECEDRERRQ